MYISNDTYELDPAFPLHMNRIWMKKYHNASCHYHWHNFYEISYVQSGQASCFVDGEFYPVRQGDIVVFNSGEVHGWEMEEDVELLVLTFSEHILDGDCCIGRESLDFFTGTGGGFANMLDGGIGATGEIASALQNAWEEWSRDDIARKLLLKAELLKILAYLNRHFVNGKTDMDAIKKKRRELKRLNQALQYIDGHYTEKLSIETIASLANMSAGHFSKFFHSVMGKRYIDYITEKRLHMAKELLETTDRTVVDIALACGFHNTANFYRAYRKIFQKAPRERISP